MKLFPHLTTASFLIVAGTLGFLREPLGKGHRYSRNRRDNAQRLLDLLSYDQLVSTMDVATNQLRVSAIGNPSLDGPGS